MKKTFTIAAARLNLFLSGLIFGSSLVFADDPTYLVNGNWDLPFSPGSTVTTLSGLVYNGYQIPISTQDFQIVFHDTNGDGLVNAHLYEAFLSGHIGTNQTLTKNQDYGQVSDGFTVTRRVTNIYFRIWEDGGLSPPVDAVIPDGQSEQFTINFGSAYSVGEAIGQGEQDSFNLNVVVELDISNDGGPYSISGSWDEVPVIHLYENGVLPPGGRPDVVTPSNSFNSNVDGNIVNNSDIPQTISLWAADENGDMQLVASATAQPGSTQPVEFGVDLVEGQAALLTSTGQVTGVGSPTLAFGDTQTLALEFPPQTVNDVVIVYDNDSLTNQQTTVGSDIIPQEIVIVPPGISEIERTYSGEIEIQGGTNQFEQVQEGVTHMVVSVPPTGQSATVVGTSTVPNSSGGVTTVSVIQTPSGNQVSSGGSVPLNPVSPPTPPNGVTGELNTPPSSSIDLGIDQVVAAINSIKAEFAAANAASPDSAITASYAPTPDSLADIETKLNDVKNGIDSLTDTGEGEEFFGIAPQFGELDSGSVSSYDFAMLGNNFTIDFSHPAVPWFRNFLLVVIGLAWFFFLIKLSNK